jgi:hypothetical protein
VRPYAPPVLPVPGMAGRCPEMVGCGFCYTLLRRRRPSQPRQTSAEPSIVSEAGSGTTALDRVIVVVTLPAAVAVIRYSVDTENGLLSDNDELVELAPVAVVIGPVNMCENSTSAGFNPSVENRPLFGSFRVISVTARLAERLLTVIPEA